MIGEKKPQPIEEAILDGRKYIVYDRDLSDWVVARWNQGFWVSVTIEPFILEKPTHFVEFRDDVI